MMNTQWSNSLCARCRHLRTTQNRRGSVFWMCGRSKQDARFPKYPPQPVGRCAGYEPQTEEA
ncbi:MAG: hypothetical protein AAFQ68_15760 [Bacteroidota bacterium]